VIAVGVFFIAWGAYSMSHFTTQTSQAGIILALTTQGVGFSCLFVPLSTVALSSIPRHLMADATGLNSLFRQVGGSIGLAIAATLLSRYGVLARTALVSHVTAGDPATMDRLHQTAGGLMARGFDPATARNLALRAIDGTIAMQSQLLAFERVFLLAGITFLLVLPLLLFLKTPEQTAASAANAAAKREPVHIEM
jgi:DHA2 family multidrug resistance protein